MPPAVELTPMVRVYMVGGIAVKVAVTDLLLSMVILAGLLVEARSPVQPENFQPASAVAVS